MSHVTTWNFASDSRRNRNNNSNKTSNRRRTKTGLENTARLVAEYAKAEGVSGIVVGLPKNMDGSCGHRAERALRFAGLVGELTGLPVATFDERLSTVQASRYLNATDTRGTKRKGVIDTLSAQIILQDALDRMKGMD